MLGRPAGLSDEEYDDEDGFSFPDEHPRSTRRYMPYEERLTVESLNNSNTHCDDTDEREEKQKLELRVMSACMMGYLQVIDEYVALGNNVNDFLHTGWTPLLYATSSVHPETIEHLLSLGADPNKHKDGYTPLMALCNSSKGKTSKFMQCLNLLISAEANVNATSNQMETCVMFACKLREPEAVTELLKHVADINVCDTEGRSALFYAVVGNKPATVKILIENNAKVTYRDRRNLTAKDIAKLKGYSEIAALLGEDDYQIQNYCETAKLVQWQDMFPALCDKNDECVNPDVATILYGMGLEKYKANFRGMDLKTFLTLTDGDLIRLGIDISVHRKKFLEDLYKFHSKKWNVRSIGAIKKSLPYSIYDGVVSLGNAAKQINIIASSFQYIKNSLQTMKDAHTLLQNEQGAEYAAEVYKTQETLASLKKELRRTKILAEKIDKENNLGAPATYIKQERRKSNWIIIISIGVITGLYLSRTAYIQRLWNE